VLSDGSVLTKCDQCETMYAERVPPEEPPCEMCWVDLLPQNKQAAQIYFVSRGQRIIAGMGGQTVDIDNNAIFGAMDRYPGGIEDQWTCLGKVRSAFHHFLAIEVAKNPK